jgi:hypothetical protein
MSSLRLLLFFSIETTFILCNCLCDCKNKKIIHLDFLDRYAETYYIMDTNHTIPLKDVAFYFLVNQTNLKCINFKTLEKFINTDSFIQKNILENYPQLTLTLYRESKNTDELIKFKSTKALAYCNNDIVVEYLWCKCRRHYSDDET